MTTVDLRQELAAAHVRALDSAAALRMEAVRFDEEARRTAIELRALMAEGEAIRVDDVEVVLVPAKPAGRRSVNVAGIHAHVESLAVIGLGPWEEPVPPKTRYPSVAAIEAKRWQLERIGVPIEALIETPPLGEPQLLVKGVER